MPPSEDKFEGDLKKERRCKTIEFKRAPYLPGPIKPETPAHILSKKTITLQEILDDEPIHFDIINTSDPASSLGGFFGNVQPTSTWRYSNKLEKLEESKNRLSYLAGSAVTQDINILFEVKGDNLFITYTSGEETFFSLVCD